MANVRYWSQNAVFLHSLIFYFSRHRACTRCVHHNLRVSSRTLGKSSKLWSAKINSKLHLLGCPGIIGLSEIIRKLEPPGRWNDRKAGMTGTPEQLELPERSLHQNIGRS